MANINAVSVPTALEHKTKLDLSFDHVTTMGFMRCQPVLYRRMMRGEHDKIKCDSIVRPAPIEVPFFGSLVQNIRYFAVKLSTIFPNWYSFINDNIASNYSDSSLVQGVPVLPNTALVKLFTEPCYNSANIDYLEDEDFLFVLGLFTISARYYDTRTIGGVEYPGGWYSNSANSIGLDTLDNDVIVVADDLPFDYEIDGERYRLGHIGRRFMTLLECLGYKVIWAPASKLTSFNYNALNLLAFIRIYIDWYCNSQYLNTYSILSCEKLFKFNDPTSNLVLTHSDLFTALNLCMRVVYDTDDYFVNAYDNPTSAVSGQFSGFQVFDPTSSGGAYVKTNVNGTPEMNSSTDFPDAIGTTYIHEALKRLTDYQKRHQLSARSIDRALAQYGAVPINLKNERSIYLGHQVNVIKSGAVMSTANGYNGESSSSVGDYAGAGFGQSSDSIEYSAEDDCIILGIATIIPQGNMVQGYDRVNRALTRFDFFQPELDFGVKAIEKGEVYVANNDVFATVDADGVSEYEYKFGFTGQYGELKRPKSFLTGDFANKRIMQGSDSWHLFRMFDDSSFRGSAIGIEHSVNFTRSDDAGQYYRIFQYVGDDYDPFYCFMHFDFAALAPCKPLFDTYDFESDGKKIDISNGNKVN